MADTLKRIFDGLLTRPATTGILLGILLGIFLGALLHG
jgi:hypothetical protein